MNWREVFKRTGYILSVASILTLLWWLAGPPKSDFKSRYYIPFAMTVTLGINLINMIDHAFIGYYFRHVRWVIFLSWLGGLPLALLLHKVSFGEYLSFSVWVILLAFVGSLVFWIWHLWMLSRGEIAPYLTSEQVVNHLGKPTETIASESGTMYLYERRKLKIFAIPGQVKAVEKIPPSLPDSILGFSPERIVNKFGWPKQVINLDAKVIYFYKNMKIIFVNGQVSDVQ